MWINIVLKKLIIAFTSLFIFSLKGYSSVSLYSSQFEPLKELLTNINKAEENLFFHFNKFKKENIQPLDLDFQDEAYFVSKEINELESYLDEQLENENAVFHLNKINPNDDKSLKNFVNDEDEEINKILNSEAKNNKAFDQDVLMFYDFSKGKKTDFEKYKDKKSIRKKDFSSASDEKISNVVKMAIKRELSEPIRKDRVTLRA